MTRPISYETYKAFAKKYGIRLTKTIKGKRKLKTIKELSKNIQHYEKNNDCVNKKGLYYY